MILNDAPANEAILSNVGEIGEFRIRNSAKAFNILSSGLYANKIRAVVRELSCNAVDSHVAAGNADTPFDVHLPNTLEPWFAVRDYGTGLTHDQVTSIYTTYFESTKTSSNAFIGALGLGSKSPFSYTDNFTVTAIKDGRKGIYSAFINGEGVPSIALMMEEESTEPAGVEVKFSVNDRYDFDKFRSEARTVYTYFSLRPVVTGCDFEFRDVEYEDKNIVPGVHSYNDSRSCRAVMGNIAYPIDVPNAETNLGDVAKLLGCGLEMHFAIGELDFQASREGLSYIPSTIAAIKDKLDAVNASLTEVLAKEANAIPNMWDRALFLVKKAEQSLWSAAVQKYVADTSFSMVNFPHRSYARLVPFKLTVDNLAKKFNIVIRGFDKNRGQIACSNLKSYNEHKQVMGKPTEYIATWDINISESLFFVINDTKNGATERAKYHWRNSKDVCQGRYSDKVIIIEAANKEKPIRTKAFFHAIANPPANRTMMASSLLQKPRQDSSVGKNVTIMELKERGYGGYYRERELVWKDAGKADSFDSTITHYYLPLSGYMLESQAGYTSAKELVDDVKESGISGIHVRTIYGVRKSDIEFIKTQKNWVNYETFLTNKLAQLKEEDLIGMAVSEVDEYTQVQYNSDTANKITNQASPFVMLMNKFEGVTKVRYNKHHFERLTRRFNKTLTIDPEAITKKYVDECKAVYARYPLLENLRYRGDGYSNAIAEYINLVDAHKGV